MNYNSISLQLLESTLGVSATTTLTDNASNAVTIATLQGGKIPTTDLPSSAMDVYLGEYATSSALEAAQPTAELGNYAFVDSTNSYWYWAAGLTIPVWVNQEIGVTAYGALGATDGKGIPYIIIPDADVVTG